MPTSPVPASPRTAALKPAPLASGGGAPAPGGKVVGTSGAPPPVAPPHHPPPVAFSLGLPARATATRAWAAATAASLEAASWLEPDQLAAVVPPGVAMAILDALGDAVKAQPTVVDVR